MDDLYQYTANQEPAQHKKNGYPIRYKCKVGGIAGMNGKVKIQVIQDNKQDGASPQYIKTINSFPFHIFLQCRRLQDLLFDYKLG